MLARGNTNNRTEEIMHCRGAVTVDCLGYTRRDITAQHLENNATYVESGTILLEFAMLRGTKIHLLIHQK